MGRSLNALDMAFLGLETQRTPVNIASLEIFEIPSGYQGNFIRDLMAELIDTEPGPPFNQRLARSPLPPFVQWVPDKNFDVHYHVRHSALPEPGDLSDLLTLVARLHSRVMDRERPLWEFHIIEGLRDNQFAIYMKIHHAAIDGIGGIALLEACLSKSPDGPPVSPWRGFREQKKAPAEPGNALDGLLRHLSRAADGIGMLPDLGKLVGSQVLRVAGLKQDDAAVLFAAPKSLFNVHVSASRRFAVASVPLSSMKETARRAESTVNDVVLAICSGALRRYLLEKDALPEESLTATIPVSIRQINRRGNQITYVGASLATDERDPKRRLEAIHLSTVQSKSDVAEVSPSAATAFAVMAQGLVALLNRIRVGDKVPPPANVVISNVPGPREPLYFGGARMLASYPLSVLVDGQALNITVVSYCDSVDFGLMACRDTVPDLDRLASHIVAAFDELKARFPVAVEDVAVH